jgi:AcrR family transcriptional regulator
MPLQFGACEESAGMSIPEPNVRELNWDPGKRSARAREKIFDAAKEQFVQRDYSSVSVSDIVKAAELSRATFYVYYPSKRDVFLELGIASTEAGLKVLAALEAVPDEWEAEHLTTWVDAFLGFFETYGGLAAAWRQVKDDKELRDLGLREERRFTRRLGRELGRLRGRTLQDAALEGAAVFAMVEGVWRHSNVTDPSYERSEVVATLNSQLVLLLSS